jgi:hypothetical protein
MEIKILNCSRTPEDNVVLKVLWQATVSKNDKTAHYQDQLSLEHKSFEDPTFVEYANLSEEQIVDWVKKAYGQNVMNAIEQKLINEIEAKNKPLVNGLPF